jgi:allophanate hydrolase subunit 2
MTATLDGAPVPWWTVLHVKKGSVLKLASITGNGSRSYLTVAGGFDVPNYLGSKSTFTLGQFGGHGGRTLNGGEAGLHPSNIHDPAYAIGTVDFTGDMPIILAHDGPSLGGFVCPATIVQAELWKIGQLKPGDKVRFQPMSIERANALELAQDREIDTLT